MQQYEQRILFLNELTRPLKIILLLFNLKSIIDGLIKHLLRYNDFICLGTILVPHGFNLQYMVEHYTRYRVQIVRKTKLDLPRVLIGAGFHLRVGHGRHVLIF